MGRDIDGLAGRLAYCVSMIRTTLLLSADLIGFLVSSCECRGVSSGDVSKAREVADTELARACQRRSEEAWNCRFPNVFPERGTRIRVVPRWHASCSKPCRKRGRCNDGWRTRGAAIRLWNTRRHERTRSADDHARKRLAARSPRQPRARRVARDPRACACGASAMPPSSCSAGCIRARVPAARHLPVRHARHARHRAHARPETGTFAAHDPDATAAAASSFRPVSTSDDVSRDARAPRAWR